MGVPESTVLVLYKGFQSRGLQTVDDGSKGAFRLIWESYGTPALEEIDNDGLRYFLMTDHEGKLAEDIRDS